MRWHQIRQARLKAMRDAAHQRMVEAGKAPPPEKTLICTGSSGFRNYKYRRVWTKPDGSNPSNGSL
jgi:hypothetical protein